jgi:uncharacterized protein with HEPN domain
MKRDYTDALHDMLIAMSKAETFVADVSYDLFVNNDEKVFAVIRALEIVGEAARSVPEDVRARYPEAPWREITGMRDKLIHRYYGVDLRRVWETVQEDLPRLKVIVTRILSEVEQNET